MDRIGELGAKTTERMRSKRLEVNKLYYQLKDRLMAHAFINDYAEPYHELIAVWNEAIKQSKQSTRKKDKEGEEE